MKRGTTTGKHETRKNPQGWGGKWTLPMFDNEVSRDKEKQSDGKEPEAKLQNQKQFDECECLSTTTSKLHLHKFSPLATAPKC